MRTGGKYYFWRITALAGKITGLFSSNNKMDETREKNYENLKSEEINDKSHGTAENQSKIEKPASDNVSLPLFSYII